MDVCFVMKNCNKFHEYDSCELCRQVSAILILGSENYLLAVNLEIALITNSYLHDAMVVGMKPKVEIESRSTLKKESFRYLCLLSIKFLL